MLTAVLAATLVMLAAMLVYLAARDWRPGDAAARSRKKTARVLARAGWTLYTRAGCGFCKKQLDLLGGAYSPQVACDGPAPPEAEGGDAGTASDSDSPKCGDPRITGYPFWFNTASGASRVGLQSPRELREMQRPE